MLNSGEVAVSQEEDIPVDYGNDHETPKEIRTVFWGGRELEPQVRFRRKNGHLI